MRVNAADHPLLGAILPERVRPVDVALRRLTQSANHGKLWFGVAAVGYALGGRYRRAALRGVGSLSVASFLSNSLIKPVVKRKRPVLSATALARQIKRQPWTSSFPSGHSASAAAFATGAALEAPWTAPVLIPLAAAVGYSRVHVGVHYRTDVVAGAAIGVVVALAGRKFLRVKPHGPAGTAPGEAPALTDGTGLTVVVNQASGSSENAADEIAALLPGARIVVWDPETSLDDAVGPDARALGVAGGDGTVASVAALALERGIPLAAFPFGTLNHFSGAVGLDSAEVTAQAVRDGSAGRIDVGLLNGTVFLNTASIGGYPDLVRRRDDFSRRIGKWPGAALALWMTLRHHRPMRLEIDGRADDVWAMFLGNGAYHPEGFAPAWRENLAEGVIDVQYLRAAPRLARTRGVLLALVGQLHRSPVFVVRRATELHVRSLEGPLPTAHDGEYDDPVPTMEVGLSQHRLTVYRPAP